MNEVQAKGATTAELNDFLKGDISPEEATLINAELDARAAAAKKAAKTKPAAAAATRFTEASLQRLRTKRDSVSSKESPIWNSFIKRLTKFQDYGIPAFEIHEEDVASISTFNKKLNSTGAAAAWANVDKTIKSVHLFGLAAKDSKPTTIKDVELKVQAADGFDQFISVRKDGKEIALLKRGYFKGQVETSKTNIAIIPTSVNDGQSYFFQCLTGSVESVTAFAASCPTTVTIAADETKY